VQSDEYFMKMAIGEAESALAWGEVPVGAVITMGDEVLAKAHNSPILMQDPTAHAEILAIRKAAEIRENYRLGGATLYVTIEPCVMCAGAIIHARIERLVFGAADLKGGALSLYGIPGDKKLNHSVAITGGILAEECGEILSRFFRGKRI
jgi:tRNA(adenine34) deaminase